MTTAPSSAHNQSVVASSVRNESVVALVSGVVADTGDLISAHVGAIRHDFAHELSVLRAAIRSAVIAGATLIVSAVAVELALAAGLIALGLAPWAAHGLVAVVTCGASLLWVRATRLRATTGEATGAIQRATDDAKWLADRAADTVT